MWDFLPALLSRGALGTSPAVSTKAFPLLLQEKRSTFSCRLSVLVLSLQTKLFLSFLYRETADQHPEAFSWHQEEGGPGAAPTTHPTSACPAPRGRT